MSWSWSLWLVGAAVLVAAGFATALVPRWRARAYTRRSGWATARAAIDRAAISRDAAPVRVPEAEDLLAEAEAIAAGHGGTAAAHAATEHAQRADRLWRNGTGP